MSKKSSVTKDLTSVLQKFPKEELIRNFFENEKKESAKIKKKDVIKKTIVFLTYIETEKVKKRKWKVFEIQNSITFSKSILSHEKTSDTLIKYFNKYGTPCKAYSEKKGRCIWMALRFGTANLKQNRVYLVAHPKLSAIFLSHMKVYPKETEKVLRKSFRGSDISPLNPITESVLNILNLNFKSFQILKNVNEKGKTNRIPERNKKAEVAKVCPVENEAAIERRTLRSNRISEKEKTIPVEDNVLRETEAASVENNILKETKVSSTRNNILKNAGVKNRKTKETEVNPIENRILRSGVKRVKNVISETADVLPVRDTVPEAKSKTYGKRTKVLPETCNYKVTEENIENDKRKRKSPHKNLEDQNLPTVENLQYIMITSPIYEKDENICDNSIFSVRFDGKNVLKGLKEMVDSGTADGPLPDYLYKEPKTGKTKFQLDFR